MSDPGSAPDDIPATDCPDRAEMTPDSDPEHVYPADPADWPPSTDAYRYEPTGADRAWWARESARSNPAPPPECDPKGQGWPPKPRT